MAAILPTGRESLQSSRSGYVKFNSGPGDGFRAGRRPGAPEEFGAGECRVIESRAERDARRGGLRETACLA
ncbi:hypothetical protein ACFCX6_01285, partial [Streptomyces sp. NPDC056353]|uniref:hypothetical protein n=1 Tax=Streptomyces sp. NPDC056353 TaxID=3345792 RepID=UPI0035E20F42